MNPRDIINYWLYHSDGDMGRALVIAAHDYMRRSEDVSKAYTREGLFRPGPKEHPQRFTSIDEDEEWLRTGRTDEAG